MPLNKLSEKIISFLDGYKYWFFGLAILAAVFLRVWDFSDAMLLKGDQVRDAVMAARSIENGLGELPLLGPRAGGTNLRLGPIFYYFQSFSAMLFGSLDPAILALPNLIFSLLAIPMFFLLIWMYFSKNTSLVLASLFAFCFLAFEYSRFTWNPNSIPFFILLFLYAWLNIFSINGKKGWKWFLLLGSAFAIASQLHFTSFIALGMFVILFTLFRWKTIWSKVGWKNLAVFLATIILFYVPVILSDILNNGDNMQLFFKSIGTKQSSHNLIQNLTREFYYFGKYFFRIAFGYFGVNKIAHYAGSMFLVGGFIVNFLLLRKEREQKRKVFLLTVFLWTLVFFVLYVPLAYEIDKPRFFLPLIFLPYLYLGFIGQLNFRFKKFILAALAIVMLAGNTTGSILWLDEFARAQSGKLDAQDTIILKTKKDSAWWTWGMIKKASAIMSEKCAGDMIYFYSPKHTAEFEDVFDWAFKLNGEKRPHSFLKKITTDKKGCIFIVTKQSYDLDNFVEIGTLETAGSSGDILVHKLSRAAVDEASELPDNIPNTPSPSAPQNHQRAYWKDVFKE